MLTRLLLLSPWHDLNHEIIIDNAKTALTGVRIDVASLADQSAAALLLVG